MAYKDKWHFGLNRKSVSEENKVGYLIQQGTYHVEKQPPKMPRFTSGSQEIQDLSYLSFVPQQDFTGGQGQKLFQDKTRFESLQNINVLSSRGLDDKPLEAGFKLAPLITEKADCGGNGTWKLIIWGGKLHALNLNTGLLVSWTGAGNVSTVKAIGGACTNMCIGYQFNSSTQVVVETPCLLVNAATGIVYKFKWNGSEDATAPIDFVHPDFDMGVGHFLYRYKGWMFTVYKDTAYVGLRLVIAWENRAVGAIPGDTIKAAAVAGDPLQLFLAAVDSTAEHTWIITSDGSTSSIQTTHYEVVAQPILEVNGVVEDMKEWKNTLLYCGWRTNSAGGKTGFIYSYPHNLIYETLSDAEDRGIYCLHTDDIVYAGASEETGLFAFDVNGFALWSVNTGIEVPVTDIIRFKGKLHFITNTGQLYEITNNAYASSGHLQTSFHDAGQPLLDKIWIKIIVGIKDALQSGEQVVVKYRNVEGGNWSTLFTWTSTDTNLKKEGFLPYNYASDRIQIRVELSSNNSARTPEIEQILLGYMPGTTKLLAWKFVVPIASGRRLLNGSLETSPTVEETRDALITLAKLDEILEYVDFNGTAYDVILHEFQMDAKAPESGKGYLATMTLMEMPS